MILHSKDLIQPCIDTGDAEPKKLTDQPNLVDRVRIVLLSCSMSASSAFPCLARATALVAKFLQFSKPAITFLKEKTSITDK